MGLSLSLLSSAWNEILRYKLVGLMDTMGAAVRTKAIISDQKDERMASRSNSFLKEEDSESNHKKAELERSLSFSNWESNDAEAKASDESSKKSDIDDERSCNPVPVKVKPHDIVCLKKPTISVPEPVVFFSPRPTSELDAAATKVQKVYKSYRTRRNLADCAVVVEELWWKALDFAVLKRSSVSFFNDERQETAVSRWSRARTKAAKVGKGLLKDEKAQKLALQHWLEAIDPRHRYGHNLHLYYDVWSESKSTQPFFYWLDIGDGKEINLEKIPRVVLQRQCIKYLGPKEREEYEVIVESGKLVFSQSGMLVNTTETSKWIFVLSTARSLYVGQKKKGVFQHSSFLSGGATTAAGRLVAHDGVLEAIWPYSGHYLPTEDNFKEFIIFLEEHNMDLSNVKRYSIDDDNASYNVYGEKSKPEEAKIQPTTSTATDAEVVDVNVAVKITSSHQEDSAEAKAAAMEPPVFDMAMAKAKRLSCKWTSGVGPRIGCVRDYPAELQSQALEQVNLSPRVSPGHLRNRVPIPSPRPSPKIRVSPRLSYMGLPSPRVTATAAC